MKANEFRLNAGIEVDMGVLIVEKSRTNQPLGSINHLAVEFVFL